MIWRFAFVLAIVGASLSCQSPRTRSERLPSSEPVSDEPTEWRTITTSDPTTFQDTFDEAILETQDEVRKNKVVGGCGATWFVQRGRRLDRDLLWIRAASLSDSDFDKMYSGSLSKKTRGCIRQARLNQ